MSADSWYSRRGRLMVSIIAMVSVTFSGTVASLGSGVIRNTAYLDSQTKDGSENNPETPSNEVTTNWGDLVIKKVDAADASVGLDGATFRIYESATPYPSADPTNLSCGTTAVGDPISVNQDGHPTTEFTTSTITGSDGKSSVGTVTIAGLFVSDSDNATANASARCYVLEEVKAPNGYVLPTGDEARFGVAVKVGETASNSIDIAIADGKQVIPGLPLTGSQTAIVMAIAGGLLVVGSVVMIVVSRRRRSSRR